MPPRPARSATATATPPLLETRPPDRSQAAALPGVERRPLAALDVDTYTAAGPRLLYRCSETARTESTGLF